MLTFKNVDRVEDVPKNWIYEYYLNLYGQLDGRIVRLHSFINNDSTPSLYLYCKNGKYLWKDHSADKGGGPIDLVMAKEGLAFKDVAKLIIKDYNKFLETNEYKPNIITREKTEYTLDYNYGIRPFQEQDKNFWFNRFNITSKLLNRFYIRPLEWFQLSKVYQDNAISYPRVENELMYGYFNQLGELYKVYRPFYKKLKFINLKHYIQGYDQLQGHDILIICSSMKDLLVIASLDLPIDVVAPNSETTTFTKEEIEIFKSEYKYIFTLFDSDIPGMKSMMKYKNLFDIDFIYIPYEKDIAEFMEKSGKNIVKLEFIIRLNKKLNVKDD